MYANIFEMLFKNNGPVTFLLNWLYMLKIKKQSSFPRIDLLDDSRNTYIYYIGAHTSRVILYPLRKRNREKGRFKSHKTFVSTDAAYRGGILRSSASAGFWIEFEIRGLDFMAAGCQMSKCRARCRVIAGDPESFQKGVIGLLCRSRYRMQKIVQFRFRFGFRVKKHERRV